MTNEDMADDHNLLDTSEVLRRYRITDSTLDNWLKKYSFPAPCLVVNRRVRYWSRAEVCDWERARTAADTEAA